MWMVVVCSIVLSCLPVGNAFQNQSRGDENESEGCGSPLGMESGKIPASRISASSSFDVKSTGPQNARIRTELVGGAWCPRSTIQEGVKEYLEIDLDRNHRITKTETQGRFGNGMGQEFTKNFQLEYWRASLNKWVPYKDHTGRSVLDGNSNTYIPVEQKLVPPVVASKLRFVPHSIHPMTVCMRVEAYGCPFTEGLIHYECPQGYWKNNPEVDLRDGTYDGWMDEDEILRGGLGTLTDTLLGPADFKTERKTQGNMWMGWDSELEPVKIGFQFDGIRRFNSIEIHVNNLVSEGVEVFASVDIYVSLDGQKFNEFPLRWIPRRDLEREKAHLLSIPLKGRLATLIRLEFFHSNHWLLLSEISFTSDPYTGNLTDEILSLNYLQNGPETMEPIEKQNVLNSTNPNDGGGDIGVLGLVIGSIGLFILCCLLLGSCIAIKRSKGKLVGDIGLGLRPKSLGSKLSDDGSTVSKFRSVKETPKEFIWSNGMGREGDRGESFYNELVFCGFNAYEGNSFSNPSSSNSTSSSNLTRSTTTKAPNTSRKIKYQRVEPPSFSEYLSLEGGLKYFGQSSPSSTPRSERRIHCQDSSIPPPPPPKFSRPPHSQLTFSQKGTSKDGSSPVFVTNTAAGHSHMSQQISRQNQAYHHSPVGLRALPSGRSTNYYAATDILRRGSGSGENSSTIQRF